jgi:hypothetical protein
LPITDIKYLNWLATRVVSQFIGRCPQHLIPDLRQTAFVCILRSLNRCRYRGVRPKQQILILCATKAIKRFLAKNDHQAEPLTEATQGRTRTYYNAYRKRYQQTAGPADIVDVVDAKERSRVLLAHLPPWRRAILLSDCGGEVYKESLELLRVKLEQTQKGPAMA